VIQQDGCRYAVSCEYRFPVLEATGFHLLALIYGAGDIIGPDLFRVSRADHRLPSGKGRK